ncbi:MAG: hypothetical protein U9N59_01300 [Campylobacterota bacterium]|nr:hypothetical protein [Campylobacterota bacterium]
MTTDEYKKLTIEEKVKLANDSKTDKSLVKKIIEEDDMDLKMQLLMSSQAIMDEVKRS